MPMELSRLETAYAYSSDRENTKLMVFLPHESRAETEEYLRECEKQWASCEPEFWEFAIMLGDVHVGALTLYFLNGGATAELGWILAAEHQKKGYATEAALGLMDFIKNELGIDRVIAQCDRENHGSRRVMDRLGLRLCDTTGLRKNRSSDEQRCEYTYEKRFR